MESRPDPLRRRGRECDLFKASICISARMCSTVHSWAVGKHREGGDGEGLRADPGSGSLWPELGNAGSLGARGCSFAAGVTDTAAVPLMASSCHHDRGRATEPRRFRWLPPRRGLPWRWQRWTDFGYWFCGPQLVLPVELRFTGPVCLPESNCTGRWLGTQCFVRCARTAIQRECVLGGDEERDK